MRSWNRAPEFPGTIIDCGFNSATTVRSWKPFPSRKSPPGESLLQFGHDREVVETLSPDVGAPSFSVLQFGHDREVVETEGAVIGLVDPNPAALQFGHDREVVETWSIAACPVVPVPRFNSATTVRSWKRQKFVIGSIYGWKASIRPRP